MSLALWVAFGAGVGAALRHLVDHAVSAPVSPDGGPRSPTGILVVNVTGSVALGVLAGLHTSGALSDDLLTVVGTGLLGGFTTFSTFTWQALEQVSADRPRRAAVYVAGSVGLGLAGLVLATTVVAAATG